MLGRSSGNHDWRFLRFSLTQRTQRKRLRLNGNRAWWTWWSRRKGSRHKRWVRSWSRSLGSQPAGHLALNPTRGCHYFSPGPRSPSQLQSVTAVWPVPNYTVWWQRHMSWCVWTTCSEWLRESPTHDLLIVSLTITTPYKTAEKNISGSKAAFRLASFWRKFLATENLPVWTGFLESFFWYKKLAPETGTDRTCSISGKFLSWNSAADWTIDWR